MDVTPPDAAALNQLLLKLQAQTQQQSVPLTADGPQPVLPTVRGLVRLFGKKIDPAKGLRNANIGSGEPVAVVQGVRLASDSVPSPSFWPVRVFWYVFSLMSIKSILLLILLTQVFSWMMTPSAQSMWVVRVIKTIPVIGQGHDFLVDCFDFGDALYRIKIKYVHMPRILTDIFEAMPGFQR